MIEEDLGTALLPARLSTFPGRCGRFLIFSSDQAYPHKMEENFLISSSG
jgi:hypothetical protein